MCFLELFGRGGGRVRRKGIGKIEQSSPHETEIGKNREGLQVRLIPEDAPKWILLVIIRIIYIF